jgi:hypothetical protein
MACFERNTMKSTLLALLVCALHAPAAETERSFAAGQKYYLDAEFRKAAVQFESVCKAGHNAEACYWAALSYEHLSDIAIPFGCKQNAKARVYLNEAARLAPARSLYREALFDLLLDSAECSRAALRDAAAILSATPEADPEYSHMLRRLQMERRWNSSGDALLGRLFLLVPRAAHRVATLPAQAKVSGRQPD